MSMSKMGRIVLASLILATVGGLAGTRAAQPQEPVSVIVQNTPLPVVPAESGGMVVQGTVAAGQSGPWTVHLAPGTTVSAPPRRIFRASTRGPSALCGFKNNSNDLVVIERVSGQLQSEGGADAPYHRLHVTTDGLTFREYVDVPATRERTNDDGVTFWAVHALTQIYLLPGEQVQSHCQFPLFLSGHYESVPQS